MPGQESQWAGRWGPGCVVKKESVHMQGVAAVLPGMDNAELLALFAAHPTSVLFLLKATAERRPLVANAALLRSCGLANNLVDSVACSN